MRQVQIVGTGSFLPGAPITNAELECLAGRLPPDILDGIQVRQRHWMIDPATAEHLVNNSEMAERACREALSLSGVDVSAVELLVVSTSSPDYLLPPMSSLVQQRLGLSRCAVIDVRSGCAGAVEALDIAAMYLANGQYRTALVVGSEAISPLLAPIYLNTDADRIRMRDRIPIYSFGDGAGAAVLQSSESATSDEDTVSQSPRGLRKSAFACVGGDRKPGMQVIGAGTHAPIHTQLRAKRLVELAVDVVESALYTPHVIAEAISAVLAVNDLQSSEIDTYIIPEGNAGYLTDELREAGLITPQWLDVADRIYENLAVVGATGSAAVMLAMDSAWKSGKLVPGDRVLLLAIETSKWIYAGLLVEWSAPTPSISALSAPAAHLPIGT